MGTDYHRATSDSIPSKGERRPVIQPAPPQGHYSAATGEWNGQLPHAEIAAQSQDPGQIQSPNWPNLLQRMEWTRATIRAHKLPPPQAAVLNEIAYRDGRGKGCTATMETIALDTGYNEKSVRRAIKGLEQRQVILGHGGPGQKKLLGLPVRNGQLYFQTPVTESGVATTAESPTPVTESGVADQTPVRESGVATAAEAPTPVRESGVGANPGHRVRGTPVRESDITSIEQRERHLLNDDSLSLRSLSSPVTESGVDDNQIALMVQENWALLQDAGWDRLGGAIRHYQAYGLEYLRRDLERKRAEVKKASLAARTCVHCQKVHESPDQVKPCVRCEDPICESSSSGCRQNPCHRKSRSHNRGKVPDWLSR